MLQHTMLSVHVPHQHLKVPLRGVCCGETEAQGAGRKLPVEAMMVVEADVLPCSLCWALITSLPVLQETPAPLTSSVGENLTRTLHRCPGARSPAKGSASKTQGLAFASCCSFRRTLAGKCLSTWAQKPTPWWGLQGQTHHSCRARALPSVEDREALSSEEEGVEVANKCSTSQGTGPGEPVSLCPLHEL